MATAESCTGGLLAQLITNIPGSSLWYEGGLITYNSQAKTSLLGVDPSLIAQYGVVSCEVAEAMAKGAAHQLGTDLAISTTGVAGPHRDPNDKAVGTVCIAWYYHGSITSKELYFTGSRSNIRMNASISLFKHIWQYIISQ